MNANKIIWFVVGNPEFVPSSRIHGLNVHNKLVNLGYNSVMSYSPAYVEEEIPLSKEKYRKFESLVTPGDIVVLQKLKSISNIQLIKRFKQSGLKIVFIDCDFPVSYDIGKLADIIICTSRFLCEEYKKHSLTAHYIEDSPEFYIEKPQKQDRKKLKCLWFGHGSKKRWNDVIHLKNLINNDPMLNDWELITVSNHPNADIRWHPGFFQDLIDADAIVIPVFNITDSCNSKSANRVLQSMALSVPVICSPVSSYTDIITQGVDGFICKYDKEWKDALINLKLPDVRDAIGKAGFATAKRFELSNLIHDWTRILELKNEFKINDPVEAKAVARKIQNIFFRSLLKKNTKYWSKERFSIYNGVYFMYTKILRAKNKKFL